MRIGRWPLRTAVLLVKGGNLLTWERESYITIFRVILRPQKENIVRSWTVWLN